MRAAQSAALLCSFLSLPILTTAATFDCNDIRESGILWNFGELQGVRTVHRLENPNTDRIKNTTFTIDICEPLKSPSKGCPMGARICAAISYFDKGKSDEDQLIDEEWPIAGNFEMNNGWTMEPEYVRLADSDAPGDNNKEGVRVTLWGGVRGKKPDQKRQKAVIEFLCNRNKTGLEQPRPKKGDDTEDGAPVMNPDKGQSLTYVSYKSRGTQKLGQIDVLTLQWETKYACEDAAKDGDGQKGDDKDDDGSESKGSWGFFTWFIIVFFLAVAAYLIFGSWLNYNRYGARGWDLLPHGDTIRDVPYLLKEWGRRVLSGGGSRDLGYIRM